MKMQAVKNHRPLFFFGGGGGGAGVGVKGLENFQMQTVLFCFRLPANTFLIPYNLLQCIQLLQTIYFTIFQPRPPPQPRQKNNGPSLTFFNLHTLSLCKFFYNKSSIVS